jgi:aminoglycoside phosphotransferase (APT) family kinase protein
MPAAEVDIDTSLVAGLVADQHPDLAGRRLRPLAHGWDNESFRLGDDLVVRLPRRAAAVELVAHEQRWLCELAARLPLPIPAPARIGQPGRGYPWAWSIVPWLPGAPWESAPPADTRRAGRRLGAFLAALHRPAPKAAPHNPLRGVPLADRAERFDAGLSALGSRVDAHRCRAVFGDLVRTPAWEAAPVWLHGDLHPLNVLVDGGALSAVLDFGDICAGDPATDLAVAWMLLPGVDRRAFREAAGAERSVDDATWQRARAWALALAVAYLAGSDDNAAMATIGRRTLAAALDDHDDGVA